jgi:CBS domain-containing protein
MRTAVSVGAVPERTRICVDRDTTVLEASRLMRSFGVEELVVADRPVSSWVPVGIVSAQDIVTRVIAADLDPSVLTAGDIAWPESVGPRATDGVADALQSLQAAGSGMLPVLGRDGGFAGFVSLDEPLHVAGNRSH